MRNERHVKIVISADIVNTTCIIAIIVSHYDTGQCQLQQWTLSFATSEWESCENGKKCSELLPHYVLLIASVCFAICVELSWYLFWWTMFRVGLFIWDKIVIYSQLTFPTD